MKKINTNKLFCNFGQHIFKVKSVMVAYPPEVGGLDIYEPARECVHCERQEIFAPLERKYIEKEEFDKLYNTVTSIN